VQGLKRLLAPTTSEAFRVKNVRVFVDIKKKMSLMEHAVEILQRRI
jgi:hypothetical protein